MINEVLLSKLDDVRSILKKHKVKRAYAFGSVCTDRFHAQSDIDLLIRFERIPSNQYAENYWSLEDELKDILGRNIDLIVEKQLKNPYLIKVLNQTKTEIYA
jgi:uncharacterized protein